MASKSQMTPLRIKKVKLNRKHHISESHLSHLVPQEPPQSHGTMSVIAQAEQASEHNDKQEDVHNKRDDHCHFGGLDVESLAGAAGSFPYIAELRDDKL